MSKRAAVLYSGGKDSTYTCKLLMDRGYDIVCLITIMSENVESYMLHTSNIEMTTLSAQALGIPLFKGKTSGWKEEEVDDIRDAVLQAKNQYGFEVLGSGGISSNYQKARIDSVSRECSLLHESPLWGTDQEQHLKTLLSEGYRFILTSVSAEGLDRSWLGREITPNALDELIALARKHRFNVSFEGGEAETLVLDCPLFKTHYLKIIDAVVEWHDFYGIFRIRNASLELKS